MRPVGPKFLDYLEGLIFPLDNPIVYFWFLPTIFILLSMAPVVKRILLANNIIVSLGILLVLVVLNILRPVDVELLCLRCVVDTVAFFYLGSLFAYYFKDKLDFFDKYPVIVVLVFGLVLTTAFWIRSSRVITFVSALIGIGFSIGLCHLIKDWKIFKPIDGYYYQIFLLSWFPQVFFRILYEIHLLPYRFAACAMLFGGLFLPVAVSKLVERRGKGLRIALGL